MSGPVPSHGLRVELTVRGQVQGVGFRPFVFRTARQLGLTGFVVNDARGATIEAQGSPRQLVALRRALRQNSPPLARVRSIRSRRVPTRALERDFEIARSIQDGQTLAEVTVDSATCSDCLRELFDPTDRRHGHALINCTHCGPRYSIVRRVPYDRCNTTMVDFAMCPACAREYTSPVDRRFHAQPIACPDCGPQVTFVPAGDNARIGATGAVQAARQALRAGRIVAVKGLGGYHLAVRADDAPAVERLRRLKHRPFKPLALMAPSVEAARRLVDLGPAAERLLRSPVSPVVLAPARANAPPLAPAVAPGNHRLGVLLAYTPLHHLLLADTPDPMPPLVMTSANDGGQPLVIDDADAFRTLAGLCDAWLTHDRPIERGVDDSVFIDAGADAAPLPVRRARGLVPAPIELPLPDAAHAVDGVAIGGDLKATVAVVRAGCAILSQHLGDLAHPDTFALLIRTVRDLCALFDVCPRWVAHDLHPAYLGTGAARRLAAEWGVPALAVQHHHAHAASLLAEQALDGPVLAIVCDGTGYGPDGATWGGELLRVDAGDFTRLARLRPLRLPGGDSAARQPWRCALALCHLATGDPIPHPRRPVDTDHAFVAEMIRRGTACIPASSAGRLFDGVASLLDLCHENTFEAQAAMALESAAERFGERSFGTRCAAPQLLISRGDDAGEWTEIDFAPFIRSLLDGRQRGEPVESLAAEFHEQFAAAWAATAIEHARRTGIRRVLLTGGTFCNLRLTRRLTELLSAAGLRPIRHTVVPPNDGGLALGQALVGVTRIRKAGG